MKLVARKLLAAVLVAMLLCVMMPVSTVFAADNLLVNGDFETGDLTGWTNLWNSCSVEIVAGRNGGSALKVSCGQWQMVRQKINVQPNTDYDLTAWAKDAANMTFLVKDGADTTNMMQVATSGGSAWTEYKGSFYSGSNTSVFISIMGNNPNATAIVDDISVVSQGGGTPVVPDVPEVPYEPVEGDLFNNGSFETGNEAGWKIYQSTRVSAVAAHTGSYGLQIVGNGGWGGLGNQTITGLEIGKTYRISLWYKALKNGVNIQLCAGTSDAGAKLAYIYGTKTEWTQFAVEFEATTTSVFFTLVGAGNNLATEMYMDDITLTEVVLGGDDEDPNLKMIDTLMGNIKTQGRTAMVGGTLMLDFSISGMEFELDCEGDVYATFNARKIANSGSDGGIYFTIVVDGEKLARDYCRITSVGETKVKLASDLPAGKHTFAIYRQSEHQTGEIGVCALSYDGEMLKKPADKGLYIEFIGDSISCGFGNLGNNSQGDGAALWSDATQAYPFLTAQALDADWSNVAWSGLGCKYGYSSTTMQDVYPAQRYNYDQSTAYDFSNEPDVIVLALGTNDNSCQSNATLKREGLVEMLALVREKNPNAPIVWIYNMMTSGVNSMVEEIVAEFGGAEAGYYACKLTMNTSGGGYHPNLVGQQKFADELVAFIQANELDVVPEKPEDPDDPVAPEGANLMAGTGTSRMEMTDELVGLAFRFSLNAQGVQLDQNHVIDLSDATVNAVLDAPAYRLVAAGAIVTNDVEIGLRPARMTHDNLSESTKDVPAVYGNKIVDDYLYYAVRVTNIPWEYSDAIVYARPYYVYECDGEEIVVYGDVYAANYDDNVNTNDGIFDW
ncbi:MAG: carbohydrate binding domain-containing protein [Clostridia bacterium]|nr:carbohydrate binding domain-containing protein [Clostridia bacterium]